MAKTILIIYMFVLVGALNIEAQENTAPFSENQDESADFENVEEAVANETEENSLIRVTSKEIEAYFKGEYNKSSTYYGDISIIGAIELNNIVKFRGGFAIGKSSGNNEFYSFINTAFYPFSRIPLNFSLSYIYNWFPEYSTHIQSIFPHISLNARIAGFTMGVNFRFTHFFDYPAIYEHIITLFLYFNIINTSSLQLRIGAGNLNDFQAKNTSAYSLLIHSTLRIDARISIVNEIEIMQTGGMGLATNLYGFAWKGGVKISF